jgi:uncharacterized protein
MLKKRYLYNSISDDLCEKMVFIGGPRQVGKTTLAQLIGTKSYTTKHQYLNWDNRKDRKHILKGIFAGDAQLVVFDEIHKYKQWKNYIKGIFDTYKDTFHILVTGSARLDLYRRGGDSLMGRYHYFRLHPFSLAEVLDTTPRIKPFQKIKFPDPIKKHTQLFTQLFTFGGFPEPFLKKNMRALRRFHNDRMDRLVKEDIRDVETVRDISNLQVLVELLPERACSLLSLNSLRIDLDVAHKTVSAWMDVLERFYYHFRVYPFMSKNIRSLKKEPKLYLWDWSELTNKAARLENIVASHLLKLVHYLHDVAGYKATIHFLRDTDGREVDFLVAVDKKPWFAVEVKQTDTRVAQPLVYFKNKLNIPFVYQVVHTPGVDLLEKKVRVISVDTFLAGLV